MATRQRREWPATILCPPMSRSNGRASWRRHKSTGGGVKQSRTRTHPSSLLNSPSSFCDPLSPSSCSLSQSSFSGSERVAPTGKTLSTSLTLLYVRRSPTMEGRKAFQQSLGENTSTKLFFPSILASLYLHSC